MSEFKPVFTKGEVNPFGQFFEGTSYLNMLSKEDVSIGDVIFEPGCINHWHIHHASQGGGQILLCLAGHGWYQEEGKPVQALEAGSFVKIPANIKHWHGSAKRSILHYEQKSCSVFFCNRHDRKGCPKTGRIPSCRSFPHRS
ncbi:cupin domain-containing protein [Erysipelotrichaceae bacterium 66-17]